MVARLFILQSRWRNEHISPPLKSMKHYLYMCFLAMTLGSTVSCQQAEELTQTLAKDEITNCFSDDRLYSVNVDTETKTATIRYFRYNDNSTVVVPSTITYQDVTYTVVGLGQVYRENKDKITSVTLPNTLQTIGAGCFEGTSIKEIDIPNSVSSIGEGAFNWCSELERVKLPEGLKRIEDYEFNACTSLKSIALPSTLEEIGNGAFSGSALESIVLPESLTELGCEAFWSSAIESIVLPESLTELGSGAFGSCENLTDIVIPSKITTIDRPFSDCTQLQSVTLGAGVKTISYGTFYYTTGLKNIKVFALEPPTFEDSDPFTDNQFDNCILYVPKASLDAYKKDVQWSKFANIKASDESSQTSTSRRHPSLTTPPQSPRTLTRLGISLISALMRTSRRASM